MMRRFRLPMPLIAVATVALVLGACLTTVGLSQSFFRKPAATTAPPAKRANPEASRSLGQFTRVYGTPFLMAPIHSGGGVSYSGIGSFSSGKSSTVHNYVFLDLTDKSVRRLIATNDHYIRGVEPLPGDGDGAPVAWPVGEGKSRVQWLLFDLVKQDTNRDAVLDGEDLRTLAVSDAGGRGYTELLGGVSDVYGQALSDPNTLVVVYRSAGGKSVSVIDLPRRVVTSTVAVPDLGPDVR